MRAIIFFSIAFFMALQASKAQPLITVTASATNSCNDNGILTLQLIGGVTPYTVQISNVRGGLVYNGSVSNTMLQVSNLPNGEYNISVRDANLGYGQLSRYRINAQFNSTYIITDQTCIGNGSISANPAGGTSPYSYSWSTGATSSSISNLSSGIYYTTITDNNGCKFHSDSIAVKDTPTINVSVTITDKTCKTGGQAIATASGGSGNYNYYWQTSPIQTSATATGLNEGWYTLVVTDQNGCRVQKQYFIAETNQFTLNTTSVNETCLNANGSITLNPSGGAAPYTYLWNTGASASSINNLSASTLYSVTATDAQGCISKKQIYLSRDNSSLQTLTSTTDAGCNNVVGGSASVTITNGTAPYTYLWSTGQTTASISNVPSGNYYVTTTDAQGCASYQWLGIGEAASCKATINGKIYHDLNGNCVNDLGEDGIAYALIEYGTGQYTYADASGNYSITVYPGSYQLKTYPPSGWTQTCLPATLAVHASTGGNTYANNNVFITPLSIQSDVFIGLYLGNQRPGFTGTNNIYYSNNNTQTETGTIEYTFSNDWNFVSATPMPMSYDAILRKATWSYSNLKPFENRAIQITMSVANTVSLGTALQANCIITTTGADINPSNNSCVANTTVVGSFDPNDIQVAPQGSGTEGYITTEDVLTYRIRFQNTGTAEAINVSVSNEIDVNLEDYTLSILDASHPFTSTIDNHTITFDFPNINLPDSTSNEPDSHGYILYRINRKSDLTAETKIYNKANIYFDYNAPVATNRVQNTIGMLDKTNTAENLTQDVILFPNPCQDKLTLQLHNTTESVLSVILYTSSGVALTLLEETNLGNGQQDLDMNIGALQLSNGLYIIKTILNNRVHTQQVIISK